MKTKILAGISVLINLIALIFLFKPDFVMERITVFETLKKSTSEVSPMFLFEECWFYFVPFLLILLGAIALSIISLKVENNKISYTLIVLGLLELLLSIASIFMLFIITKRNEDGAYITYFLGKSGYIFAVTLFVSSIYTMIFASKIKPQ